MSRGSAMSCLAEINGPHLGIAGDLTGASLDEDPAADHDDDAAREAEHDVHVVLDEEHRELRGETGDRLEEHRALEPANTRRRLVEQQQPRTRRGRERDLESALPARRESADRFEAISSLASELTV